MDHKSFFVQESLRWIPALFWFFAPIGQQQENDISQRQIGGTTLGRYIKLMQRRILCTQH